MLAFVPGVLVGILPPWDPTLTALWTAVTAVATAVAAGAAVWAARAARDAARETHTATQAQLVASLLDAYASAEMLTAIHTVREWKKGDSIPPDSALDRARRQVSHHFQKIATLKRAHILDDDLLRVVTTAREVALFCRVIEPMEKQINSAYDPTSFDVLADFYGGRELLPRD